MSSIKIYMTNLPSLLFMYNHVLTSIAEYRIFVQAVCDVCFSQVIGICGGAEKCQLVKSYGAIETIDHTKEDFKDRIKQLTRGNGVDIVVDAVGGKVFEDCLRW